MNLAARLQELADAGGILLDNETYHLVNLMTPSAEEMHVKPKGFSKPVRAYRVQGAVGFHTGILSLDAAGIQIRMNQTALTQTDRDNAIEVLQTALDELKGY